MEAYAQSVRAYCETVLRCFYEFHLNMGSGPITYPFPLDRTRRSGRAHLITTRSSHFATSGAGCTGRERRPGFRAASPHEEFNEIFTKVPSHRDGPLVVFYVSAGARASELLSATLAGIDPAVS